MLCVLCNIPLIVTIWSKQFYLHFTETETGIWRIAATGKQLSSSKSYASRHHFLPLPMHRYLIPLASQGFKWSSLPNRNWLSMNPTNSYLNIHYIYLKLHQIIYIINTWKIENGEISMRSHVIIYMLFLKYIEISHYYYLYWIY